MWFGGQSEINVRNDFWRIDLSSKSLQLFEVHKDAVPPKPRALHEAATVGNKMLVFGGKTVDNEVTNELLMYDIDLQKWLIPDIKTEKPLPRIGHTVSSFGDSLYVFGGQVDSTNYLNDLWQYSVLQNTWTLISSASFETFVSKYTAVGSTVTTTPVTEHPSARAYHTMNTNGTHLFVFGGKYANVLDEFYTFDISTYEIFKNTKFNFFLHFFATAFLDKRLWKKQNTTNAPEKKVNCNSIYSNNYFLRFWLH